MQGINFRKLTRRDLFRWNLGLLVLLSFLVFGQGRAFAQVRQSGNVSGVVLDSLQGEPVPGAVVSVRGTTLGTKTDEQGRYTLTDVPSGDHILIFSKSGFDRATVADVRVLMGQTSRADSRMNPEFYEMDTYEVVAQLVDDQAFEIMADRQSSANLLDAIGSDMISKLGASDAADVVTKVAGSTIIDGKFAVVRGLDDRYVPTLLNGARVPSSDPYRQAASLDQFPSPIIERVTITKTFTPDQPGDFTGGGVNVVTKKLPDEAFVKVKIGAAYNTQATGNGDFLSTGGGGTDWLGMDDGTRELPDDLQPGIEVPTDVRSSALSNTEQIDQQNTLNDQTVSLGTAQFAPDTKAPPPDTKFDVSFGKTWEMLGQTFGVVGALTYFREFRFYEDGVQERYQRGDDIVLSYDDTRSLTTVNWAAMASLGARLWDNHEVALNFLYTQTAQDTARQQVGTNFLGDADNPVYLYTIEWLERSLGTLQLEGGSLFPALGDLRLDYLLAGTQTSEDQPDTRQFNFFDIDGQGFIGGANLPSPNFPSRTYANLEENTYQAKVDLSYPFDQWSDLEASLKAGFNGVFSSRDYWSRLFSYNGATRNAPWTGTDPNTYLTEENLGYDPTSTSSRITWNWQRYITADDSSYNGNRSITAGYLMTDLPLIEPLRLIGGARLEVTDIDIYSESFFASSATSLRTNTTKLNQTDILPAIGLVWSLRKDMQVRLNYSQTVARPSFRELAAYRSYDPNLDIEIEGNPNLQITSINNYDIRWEWFPRPSEVLSVSAFYKSLQLPIERQLITIDGSLVSWQNRESGEVAGLEFEARTGLDRISASLANFNLGGNLALIYSSTEWTDSELEAKRNFFPDIDSTRPLASQSPYILNADISYDNTALGTSLALVYNIFGPRLILASLNTEDVYEQPAPSLDFIARQKLGKGWDLKFAAKNLLNPVRELTYGEDGDLPFSSYTIGRTFGLEISYEF